MRNKGVFVISLVLMLGTLFFSPSIPQTAAQPAQGIDAAKQLEIIDSVASVFNRLYVFENVAGEMAAYLHKRYDEGGYADITSERAFAWALEQDLRSVSGDQHIRIRHRPDEYFERVSRAGPSKDEIERRILRQRQSNFDFQTVESLPGNVGYVKFNSFSDPKYAAPTAIAGLNFLGNSDAIIIDLRDNGGGSPLMVQFLASYFFDEATHINSLVSRGEGTEQQLWTHSYVPGPRMAGMDIYVLVSYDTFSAGEALAYHLQQAGKATIVGDSTAGGAHQSTYVQIQDLNIEIKVPCMRAVSAFSKTNWEGVGLQPDIKVPSYEAFDVAYLHAVKRIKEKSDDAEFKARLDWLLPARESKVKPVFVGEEVLQSYVGQYGPIKVFYANGSLFFEYENRRQMKMYPMSEMKFRCGVFDEYQIEFHLDDNGVPCAGTISFEDGTVFKEPKT